ncbi:MAG: lysophospholipid acyltransferase family protein [Thermodesulfobacteriota bacterium]|nr:lysophospholipid acyltransferase family protein [Thermodesulfobacteriota bacterium]
MINRIIAASLLVFIALSSVLFYVMAVLLWLCTVWFDRRLVALHFFTSFWASVYLWVMPAWSVSAKGRKKVKKGKTYMVVSNHQSQLDILIAFRLFFPFKWVSKAEVFKLPLIGWNMVLNRYIKLKRGNKESVEQMMIDCEKNLSNGSSVYFFPEGTRSYNGIVKEFKTGAFILAHKMKIPILPIVINGSKNALPKHSLNFHGKHRIRIEVLDELPYESFAQLSVEKTARKVRKIITQHVYEHREAPLSA